MSGRKAAGIALIAVLVLSIGLLLVVQPRERAGFARSGDAIALVRLSGPIQEGGVAGIFGGAGITPGFVRERLNSSLDHPRVRAVVLRIDSPGGTVASSQEIATMIEEFPLPIVVSMGDVAASGGYYIASAADEIIAQPGTTTGSIGVIYTLPDLSGLFERYGIQIETVTAGDQKDIGFIVGGLDDEQRAIIQELADIAYDQFVTAVADGRGLDPTQVRELATGQPYIGEQALELGLVDALGGLDEAVEAAMRLAGLDDAELIEYQPGFFDVFFGGPGWSITERLLGPRIERLLPDELVLLREVLEDVTVPRYQIAP